MEQSGIVRTIFNFFIAAFIIFVRFVVVQFGSGCGSGSVCCIDLLVKTMDRVPKGFRAPDSWVKNKGLQSSKTEKLGL